MTFRTPAGPPFSKVVPILSFIALTLCLWLFSRKLSGEISSIAGCGGEGGCSSVLGGRWSEWFHLPVTLLAAGVHFTVFLCSLPPVRRAGGIRMTRWLAAAAVILAGSAGYFLAILYLVERQHCPWCLTIHLTGLAEAGLILTGAWRQHRGSGESWAGRAVLTGTLALGILAAGQKWGPRPKTFLITGEAPASGGGILPSMAGGSRVLRFFDGTMAFDAAALPVIGSPAAPAVLVEFFDYTCASCRDLAGDLKALKEKWPGTFAVVVLPAPLNRACNPALAPSVTDHPGACELARLALALWRAKPEAFPAFHDFLFSLPLPAVPERLAEARKQADQLAGEAAMESALASPWVAARLQANFEAFARLTAQSIKMPKLLLHDSVMMHGTAPRTGEFLRVMEEQFGLSGKSPPAVPGAH